VLDAGYVRLDIERANPARWKGKLDKIFSPPPDAAHHAAMPYAKILGSWPACAGARSRRRELEFLILAGLRLREVLDATWEEINWDEMAWEIPGPRMKNREPHNVPLVGRMVKILREQEAVRPEGHPFVFPGQKARRPLDNGTVHDLLKRMGVDVVAHTSAPRSATGPATRRGFRATASNTRWRTRSGAPRAITGAAPRSRSDAS
jgi:integrase